MPKFTCALTLMFAALPLLAQDAAATDQKRFAGVWEAKVNGKVVCTIRVKTVDPISGETAACNISVDGNGDLQEPQSSEPSDDVTPMNAPKVTGDTLSFEERDNNDVIKFELKIVGEGHAELKILDAPMSIKPIPFARK